MKICIIGGGAAGLMAAALLSKTEHEVFLFEKNEKLGKKLYITGKGRCNFTNNCTNDEFIKNVISNPKFLYSAINSFSPQDVISFFEKRGLKTKCERGNRMFPESDKSSDVIKTLSVFSSNVRVFCDTEIVELVVESGIIKGVRTKNNIYSFDSVIVATGGISYPSTGSTGDGYKFAKSVGHNVVEPKPSLCGLISPDKSCKALEGLSLKNVNVKVFVNEKEVDSEFGEMLFTANGVSGPCILTLSSKICRRNIDNCFISIDLKPALSYDLLDDRILRDFCKNNGKIFKNSLDELLPKSLIPIIIERSGISQDKKVSQISATERSGLVNLLKDFRLKISSLAPFSQAVITSGGVSTKEINPKTMESKKVQNLYFIGEVLDVDALTGGYNLQIAFSTAKSAVNAIIGD